MQDNLQPIIHKAPVRQLRLSVAQSGLSIGDKVEMRPLDHGGIGVFATLRRRWLGLFSRRVDTMLGELAESASDVVAPALARGDALRVRIVDLTPEHLARDSTPGLHISIWGDPEHMAPAAAPRTPPARPGPAETGNTNTSPATPRPAAGRSAACHVNGAAKPRTAPPAPAPEDPQERGAPAAQSAEAAPTSPAPESASGGAPKGVIFRKSRIHDGPAGR